MSASIAPAIAPERKVLYLLLVVKIVLSKNSFDENLTPILGMEKASKQVYPLYKPKNPELLMVSLAQFTAPIF